MYCQYVLSTKVRLYKKTCTDFRYINMSTGEVPADLCLLCCTKPPPRSTTFFQTWGEEEREFVKQHLGKTPQPDRLVCKKHLLEAQRYHNKLDFVPKWKGSWKTNHTGKCTNPNCSEPFSEKLIAPTFEALEKLEAVFSVKSSEQNPFLVCTLCYAHLHRTINKQPNCASCGANPKPGTRFCRYSPDPAGVSYYLNTTTGSEVTIQPTDMICTTCYRLHVAIINDESNSLCTLEDALKKWRDSANESTETATKAVLTAVILVGEHFLQNKALLLPQVCRVFVEAYGVSVDAYTNISCLNLLLELGNR